MNPHPLPWKHRILTTRGHQGSPWVPYIINTHYCILSSWLWGLWGWCWFYRSGNILREVGQCHTAGKRQGQNLNLDSSSDRAVPRSPLCCCSTCPAFSVCLLPRGWWALEGPGIASSLISAPNPEPGTQQSLSWWQLQGQVENIRSGFRGGHGPCQLGLTPGPGCVCTTTVAVIRDMQFRARATAVVLFGTKTKGTRAGRIGKWSIVHLKKGRHF